jgi:hypothetical protein
MNAGFDDDPDLAVARGAEERLVWAETMARRLHGDQTKRFMNAGFDDDPDLAVARGAEERLVWAEKMARRLHGDQTKRFMNAGFDDDPDLAVAQPDASHSGPRGVEAGSLGPETVLMLRDEPAPTEAWPDHGPAPASQHDDVELQGEDSLRQGQVVLVDLGLSLTWKTVNGKATMDDDAPKRPATIMKVLPDGECEVYFHTTGVTLQVDDTTISPRTRATELTAIEAATRRAESALHADDLVDIYEAIDDLREVAQQCAAGPRTQAEHAALRLEGHIMLWPTGAKLIPPCTSGIMR